MLSLIGLCYHSVNVIRNDLAQSDHIKRPTPTVFYYFVPNCFGSHFGLCKTYYFRNACYHVGTQSVTQAQAEVACGQIGGRLASFVERSAINALRIVLQPWVTPSEMWLGKARLGEVW
jgi:hypothetical protein